MPSAKRNRRSGSLAVLVLCGVVGAGSLSGCETTQEKAAAHQAESERILEAREKRQQKKQQERKDGKEQR